MQAKDIPDVVFLDIVEDINCLEYRWAQRWDIEEKMPDVPPKVILAKARNLIKRNLMSGCGCGCRGDFEVVAPDFAKMLDTVVASLER